LTRNQLPGDILIALTIHHVLEL